MAELHKALEWLRQKEFSEVPVDNLAVYFRDCFAEAELIVNSVPPPPGGDEFSRATRSRLDPNGAAKASEMTSSNARPPPPTPAHEELQKGWGKPLKIGAKDNPMGVSVYKMAGHDRHGAWFARRSVHEGLGFAKWKKAMQREFPESLAVQAGPGEGSVRGIGGDRRLERQEIEGVGKMEVYELSAKFPAPTSPRDFVTLLLTTDTGLTDCSAIPSGPHEGIVPRHYMLVSIPVQHPDAPPRQGLVRGQYESVEIIREIPLSPAKTRSATDLLDRATREKSPARPRSSTAGAESRRLDVRGERLDVKEPGDDPELNPVEWIMVTRSDPGGGIPRFLVDRGTPPSIAADTVKFLDWACAREDFASDDEEQVQEEAAAYEDGRRPSFQSFHQSNFAGLNKDMDRSAIIPDEPIISEEPEIAKGNGIIATVENAFQGGMGSIAQYTPDVVKNNLPGTFPKAPNEGQDSDDDDTETSSLDSFASAEPYYTAADGTEEPAKGERDQTPVGLRPDRISTSSPSSKSLDSLAKSDQQSLTSQTTHEKELAKLDSKKRNLDEKFAASREKQAQAQRSATAKTEEEATKKRERYEKEIMKQEERHQRELRKLEERKEKERRKAEARAKKEADKDALAKANREKDEFKQRVEVLERENALLREQMGELQKENTRFVAKMGKSEPGVSALKQVRDEIANEKGLRGRGTSVGSVGSMGSIGSPGRGRAKERDSEQGKSQGGEDLVGGQL